MHNRNTIRLYLSFSCDGSKNIDICMAQTMMFCIILFVDFGYLFEQTENKATSLRKAHLHWLIDNNVYSNNIHDYQQNLRQHSPSNSARYPMRMTKDQIDPEWGRLFYLYAGSCIPWLEVFLFFFLGFI